MSDSPEPIDYPELGGDGRTLEEIAEAAKDAPRPRTRRRQAVMASADPAESTPSEAFNTPDVGSDINKMLMLKIVAIAVPVALFVWFAAQNRNGVDVEFALWDFRISRILLMALSAAVGAATAELIRLIWRRRSSNRR